MKNPKASHFLDRQSKSILSAPQFSQPQLSFLFLDFFYCSGRATLFSTQFCVTCRHETTSLWLQVWLEWQGLVHDDEDMVQHRTIDGMVEQSKAETSYSSYLHRAKQSAIFLFLFCCSHLESFSKSSIKFCFGSLSSEHHISTAAQHSTERTNQHHHHTQHNQEKKIALLGDAIGVKVNNLGFCWVMGDANWELCAKG